MFSGIDKSIVIAKLSFQRCHFVTRITGNDTVNQRRAEAIGVIQPLDKRLRQRPLLRIAQHQFAECFTVVVDKLARNDNPAFVRCAVKVAKALKQQSRQFRRIAYRRGIVELVSGVIADTGFRGVRKDKTHIGVVGQRQKRIILIVDADFTVNGADKTRIAYRLTLLIQTPNDGGVQTLLGAERWREIALDRANNHHAGIKIGMLV